MMRELTCAYLLASADAPTASAQTIRIDGEHIASVGPAAANATAKPLLALPALANAHDHARIVRSSSLGASGKPLEIWLHYMALVPSVDPYLAAAVSLARSALGGAGVVMVHYTRTQGLTDLPAEAAEVSRAARDVGVRVGFAVAMRNRNPLVYGPSEPILDALPAEARGEIHRRFVRTPLSPDAQLALVDAVADAAGSANFDVQYGPQGVQWCTAGLLEAIAEASARTGRRVHMHLLETRYQRAWADNEYPRGIVRYLDDIGLLSPRLTLAHCTWARTDELDLIAQRGAIISANASSNLTLRSGVAPVGDMIKRGCRVALGLDGATIDEDDDALRELRLSHLLHGGTGFRIDVRRAETLKRVLRTGRTSVLNRNDGGTLAAGEPADILLLDWKAVDDDRLRTDVDPLDLVFARATARHIREMIVGGRTVVREGKVMGIDLPAMRDELHARLRTGMNENAAFAAALGALERVVHPHFETEAPCC
jgi:cytosine/adenosine deaminase-related metal-dependent hydrolase